MLRASEDRAKESGKRSTSAHDGRGVWEREGVGVDRRRKGRRCRGGGEGCDGDGMTTADGCSEEEGESERGRGGGG